jgi:hypothetical protein
MRILATAKPNQTYENLHSISDLVLQAQLINNNVSFYETHEKDENWVKRLSVELVKSMFIRNKRIIERPFLASENRDFYTVLYRDKRKFKERYKKLKNNWK